mgnify:FL=1
MNDTIPLNDRQKKILNLLGERGEQSRQQLSKFISQQKTYSKITLIRDINHLLNTGLISVTGRARAVKYFLPHTNPLLAYFDIESYFEKDQDSRGGKKGFEKDIFDKLQNVFTSE